MGRILIFLIVGIAMLALVLYSQYREESRFVSGTIEAEQIRLGSRLGGRVEKVHVREGATVKAGQPLIELESFDLDEQEQQALEQLREKTAFHDEVVAGLRSEEVEQARLRYEEALASEKLVIAGPRPEEIKAAENRLKAAQAELQLAKREFDRISEAFQENSVSRSAFDTAEEKFTAAMANVSVRENELEILKAGPRPEEIDMAKARTQSLRLQWELARKGNRSERILQAKAARDAAQAALERIREQKKELVIRAPRAGTVDALDLYPGDLVAPNAPVVTLVSDDSLRVRTYVPQRYLNFRVGSRVKITVDSLPRKRFAGQVLSIASQAEFIPKNVQTAADRVDQVYRTRILIVNPVETLHPGMTVNVWFDQ